tara:strand:- start:1184 stop:1366 length:183 start_codon:yes stop_codon:yes gene_type:complete
MLDVAKKYGHYTSAQDEEGLVYYSEQACRKSRLAKKYFDEFRFSIHEFSRVSNLLLESIS